MAMCLTKANLRKIHRILAALLDQTEADGVLLCDEAGHVLDAVGIGSHDPHLLSALGAGVFAATGELARLLGEDEFSTVLHQGCKKSILMCAVKEEAALLCIVFSNDTNVGIVKVYAPSGATAIRAVLEAAEKEGIEVDDPIRAFVLSDSGEVFNIQS